MPDILHQHGHLAPVTYKLANWQVGSLPSFPLENTLSLGWPQIVHFNCGIHDTKRLKSTGKFQVSPQQYESNLRAIVEQIRAKTDAVVLFATTTPILDDRAAKALQSSIRTPDNSRPIRVPRRDVWSEAAPMPREVCRSLRRRESNRQADHCCCAVYALS